MVISAARAASAVSQLALDITTARGETLGMPLAATAASGAWVAESGGYTPVDTTITNQNLGAFKAATKLIVSEELRIDEAVELDSYLAFELGGRLGSLIETAVTTGDGSGKPLGLVHASSPYTVSTAPTGNTTSFSAAAIQQFYLALPAAYRPFASWLIAADDFGKLAGLTGSGGAPGLSESADGPAEPVLSAGRRLRRPADSCRIGEVTRLRRLQARLRNPPREPDRNAEARRDPLR